MKLSSLLTTALITTTIFVSGCANKNMQTSESGFLESYENLDKRENLSKTKAYIAPGSDFSQYKNIYIAPIKIISKTLKTT